MFLPDSLLDVIKEYSALGFLEDQEEILSFFEVLGHLDDLSLALAQVIELDFL